MKLRSLKLHGFKSFADRTEIQFHEGITAIVGPNGCGKSNISDAIRWVLGEQRPAAIRGAKMEEAIFQGSVKRRPVNRGSVVMGISNEDGVLPVPFEEVEIGRTVYRDGGSEYSINRSTCRLRDVHDLCRDTGLGANAYSVIEGRMIDAILSDRAEERRGLFEEAAGIGKYKDRRKAALRRLERAELDLQRLDDVIGEVETKVRSLARQRGKAERYHELRARRLAVDVAVVGARVGELGKRLDEVARALEGDAQSGEGVSAELEAAETRQESLRIEQLEAEKARGAAAARLDEVRSELVRWERDLAVAEERALYAGRRLETIEAEREESRDRVTALAADEETLGASSEALAKELEEARAEAAGSETIVVGVRARLQEARDALEAVEGEEREVLRRGAQLEGDAEGAEAQAAELTRRLERLSTEMDEAADALTELRSQGDLFSDRLAILERAVAAATKRVEGCIAAASAARERFEALREADVVAADENSSLQARLSALEAVERDQEGVEPVVRAALARKDDGVLGTLADFVSATPELVGAVERYLGPLTRGLVVRDGATASRLQRWFVEEWEGGGGLILLPLDRVPAREKAGTLLRELKAEGAGAPWVEVLLAGVDLVDDDALLERKGTGERLTRSGLSVDGHGVVRIGNPSGASGILERREALRALRSRAEAAAVVAREARDAREEARAALARAEEALETERAAHRAAEDAARMGAADEAAQLDRRGRMDRQREELEQQVEAIRASRDRALERGAQARAERSTLLGKEEALRDRRSAARATTDAVQEEWEAARAEESRIAIRVARVEGEAGRVRERQDDLARARTAAGERIVALDAEQKALEEEMEKVRAFRSEGADRTETLFTARDASEAELRARDARLTEVVEAVADFEKRVRNLRSAERESIDRRHRLEMEQQEISGRLERIRERVESEWGKPMQRLLDETEPAEGEVSELQSELLEVVSQLEGLGPVNMLAVEEHAEEQERLDFLTEQRDDLMSARDDLRSAVREINQTATTLFHESFETIRENFRSTFQRLFEGGECDLWLSDPEDPLESAIEVHASPVGKRTQRIDLLSGGERALTA
ncbi:MAG: chromosome segregation protein SMC, partial [Gemmatimonadota bacterium]